MQTCEIYCRKSINKKITRQPRRRLSKKLDRAAQSAAGSANWKLENACAYLWLPLWVCVFLLFLSAFTICMRYSGGCRKGIERKRGTSPLPEHEPGFDNFLPLPGLFSVFVLLLLLITLFLRFTFYFYIDFIFIESFCSSLKFVFG